MNTGTKAITAVVLKNVNPPGWAAWKEFPGSPLPPGETTTLDNFSTDAKQSDWPIGALIFEDGTTAGEAFDPVHQADTTSELFEMRKGQADVYAVWEKKLADIDPDHPHDGIERFVAGTKKIQIPKHDTIRELKPGLRGNVTEEEIGHDNALQWIQDFGTRVEAVLSHGLHEEGWVYTYMLNGEFKWTAENAEKAAVRKE